MKNPWCAGLRRSCVAGFAGVAAGAGGFGKHYGYSDGYVAKTFLVTDIGFAGYDAGDEKLVPGDDAEAGIKIMCWPIRDLNEVDARIRAVCECSRGHDFDV
jgi:hypothetical protein